MVEENRIKRVYINKEDMCEINIKKGKSKKDCFH